MRDEVTAWNPTWDDNAQLIAAAAKLGYIKGRVLDASYGQGNFWSIYVPDMLTANDLDVAKPAMHHQDFRATSWESCSFDTVVLDGPYKMAGTPSAKNADMDAAYGTSGVMSRNEILTLLVGGIAEGCRLTRDLLLVKVMDQINGGRYVDMVQVASDAARAVEMHKVASLLLPGGGRKQPTGTSQQHPRKDYSSLLVFGKKTR